MENENRKKEIEVIDYEKSLEAYLDQDYETRMHSKPESPTQFDFWYYTSERECGISLAKFLREELSYNAPGVLEEDGKWLVCGWTTPLLLTNSEFFDWHSQMVEHGERFNCKFDGYGSMS